MDTLKSQHVCHSRFRLLLFFSTLAVALPALLALADFVITLEPLLDVFGGMASKF
jgi:hypothetical protein